MRKPAFCLCEHNKLKFKLQSEISNLKPSFMAVLLICVRPGFTSHGSFFINFGTSVGILPGKHIYIYIIYTKHFEQFLVFGLHITCVLKYQVIATDTIQSYFMVSFCWQQKMVLYKNMCNRFSYRIIQALLSFNMK